MLCPYCGRNSRTHHGPTAVALKVADLIADGMSNKDIGAELHIAVRTVKQYVNKLLAHHDFRSRIGIAIHYYNKRSNATRDEDPRASALGQSKR